MFEKLLEKIGKTFTAYHIPYMIIGGQAVLLYGEPRLTKDIDITLGFGIEDIGKIKDVIRILDLTPLVESIDNFVKQTFVLPTQDKNTGIRIDFIFSYSTYEKKAIEKAKSIKIGDEYIRFISIEDLIIHKIIAGRPRDIEDIQNILLKNPEVDEKYIIKWLAEFEKSTGENFTKIFEKVKG